MSFGLRYVLSYSAQVIMDGAKDEGVLDKIVRVY